MVTGLIPSFFPTWATNNGIQKKEEADCLLTILFHKTLHSGYFAKLPFGSKEKFEKMHNTILPLVVLTWLHQLQEHFYEIGDNKESGDWNVHGKYCAVSANNVSKDFLLDNVHMTKANSTSLVKVDSVTYIKPNGKPHKTVVKSLEEWVAKTLCQDNDYVQNIAKSDDKTKKRFKRTEKHGLTQYAMLETSYKPADVETSNSVNIVKFTPQQQQKKTPEQLFLHVSNFMKDKIETLEKNLKRKMRTKKTSNCSTVQMKRQHVLLNLSIKNVMKTSQHLQPCKNTWKKAMNQKKQCVDDSSEEENEEE